MIASYKITEQNISKTINNDMVEAKKNIDLYLKQYFMVYNMELNKTSLTVEAGNISRELSSEIGNNVEIYGLDGQNLSNPSDMQDVIDKGGLSKAINGEISYTINHKDKNVFVSLSYPIEADNNIIGAVRYYKDYTEIYSYNERFRNILNIFAVIIFIIIFIMSFILSKQITKPIRELIKNSEQIAKGDFDSNINVKSKDEIGELASRFRIMIQKIKNQIEVIKRDRDALKEAQIRNKAFFDNATHELKTPLTTILGYAQIIGENGFSDRDFFDKGISVIINESKRLNKLVADILEISKYSSEDFSYHFEKINLSEILTETCDEMKIKGRKYGIDINVPVQDGLFIEGDRDKIKEVIVNLVDNSLKYGYVNSVVNCEAYYECGYIYVKVKDRGEGIPEEQINNLYDPFFRVSKKISREKGSVGLGLTIVKNIVEKHNGTIIVNSREMEGTEVILKFRGEQL
jgi:Signal transduction histidine kinase